jgi:hypothetical protein
VSAEAEVLAGGGGEGELRRLYKIDGGGEGSAGVVERRYRGQTRNAAPHFSVFTLAFEATRRH